MNFASASPITIECEQGSPAWHLSRAGKLTASTFKHFRTSALTKKATKEHPAGSYNAEARKLIRRAAFERLSGRPLQGNEFETYAMRRGHALEPFARQAHEKRLGIMVDRAGFVMTPDGKFGCSADGYIDHDEGSEYKCLVDPDELLAIYEKDDISSFIDQMMGCMWITGRRRWHFGLYCPDLAICGMDLKLMMVDRDEDFVDELEADMMRADRAVCALVDVLKKNPLYVEPLPPSASDEIAA